MQVQTDKEIGGKRLNTGRAVKFVLSPVDIFLLVDLTGSFGDDISAFKSEANSMIQELLTSGLDIYLGLGKFEDYPISPWGDAGCGDQAYKRIRDIRPPDEDADQNGIIDIDEAIQSLTVRCGNDTPESQLPALFQLATGAGQDLPPTGSSAADIPAGQQANFRPTSTRIVVIWTDARFHQPGDSIGIINGLSIPYPGPSISQTINALNGKSIKVIGISASSSANADLRSISVGTNTFAPLGGVDCDGNGTIDVLAGQPLVCPLSSTGQGIGRAIVNTVLSISE